MTVPRITKAALPCPRCKDRAPVVVMLVTDTGDGAVTETHGGEPYVWCHGCERIGMGAVA